MSGDARLILVAGALLAAGVTRLSIAERGLLGWAGLRGGIPVVLATLPVINHVPHSVDFFDLVFFAVLVSTLLQGATVEPLARRLGVSGSPPPPGRTSQPAPQIPPG